MWIVITLAATVIQVWRTTMQQRLRTLLSINGAGFVRYAYGAPLAALAVVALLTIGGQSWPTIPGRFWWTVTGAGVAQIVGTVALITAFDLRDYALGIVYAKTEVVQVAVFSALFLGEALHLVAWVAIVVCMVGVVLLALRGAVPSAASLLRQVNDPAAIAGIVAGGCFALAAVGIRASSTSLGDAPVVVRAVVTLAVMNTIQTVLNGAYLAVRERAQLRAVVVHWRSSAVVGALSVCGSAGWALAMTIESAAKVRTLGQVELLLTFAVSHRVLRESHVAREYVASALVLAGVLGVVLVG